MSPRLRSVAWILGVACTTATAGARDIQGDAQQYMRESKLTPNQVGYSIIDCDKGIVVAGHNAKNAFAPASNLKLVTTAAALDVLGPNFAFETHMIASVANGRTTLTLIGGGDPALFDPEALRSDGSHGNWTTIGAAVDAWAASLRAQGIAKIDEFVLDARIFDEESIPTGDPKWESNEKSGTYAVGVWGFNIAGNAAVADIGQGGNGRPGLNSIDPPLPLVVTSNEATFNPKRASTFSIRFGKNPAQLSFAGNLKDQGKVSLGIHDPLPLSAAMFAREFSARGIPVNGWRVAAAADPAASGTTVQPVLRTPIATVLHGANTDSRNLYAEALAKRMGAASANPAGASIGPGWKPGSWENGTAAARAFVDRRLGSGCSGSLCMRDGSGLSDVNRFTPDLAARLLATYANDRALCTPYFGSLARPGTDGTLKKRFKESNLAGATVLGKSGYIAGVSCLSGVVLGSDGRTFSYSVLCNDPTMDVGAAKRFQERVVERIARELATARVNTARVAD